MSRTNAARSREAADAATFGGLTSGLDLSSRSRMSTDASHSPSSLQIARRLLAREAAKVNEGEREMVVAALQRACLRVSDNLRESLGDDGCNALLVQALARTEASHPPLKDIRRWNDVSLHLDGVPTSVEAHGVAAVTAAIEALIATLAETLSRLIGEDMAIRLIDHDATQSHSSNGAKAP